MLIALENLQWRMLYKTSSYINYIVFIKLLTYCITAKRDLEVDVDIEERSIAGECRYAGIAYQGKQTKTGTGRMCMNWAAKDPHS